jgi:hypothetical protein
MVALPVIPEVNVNFLILNETPFILLHFLFSCKIPSIMTYHLSTFDGFFRSYKQMKIDILAVLPAICDKTVRDRKK